MTFINISFVYRGPGQGSETHANKYLYVMCTVKFLIFERKSQHSGRSPRNTRISSYFLVSEVDTLISTSSLYVDIPCPDIIQDDPKVSVHLIITVQKHAKIV
jgi:hypothetical protein